MAPHPPANKNSSTFKRLVSSVKNMILNANDNAHLGKRWQGLDAMRAFDRGELKSVPAGGKPLRVAFRNVCSSSLLLCWVSRDSQLHHFYKLAPQYNCAGQSANSISIGDHVECTVSGDAFCLVSLPEEEMEEAQKSKSLPQSAFIVAGFMPNDYQKKKGDEKDPIYLVTVDYDGDESRERNICCQAPFLSKRPRQVFEAAAAVEEGAALQPEAFFLRRTSRAIVDPTPYDTSNKFYERKVLGGWPVYMEPNWHGGDESIEKRLCQDLEAAAKILPAHAADCKCICRHSYRH